jgi:hypothetical protein
VLRAHAQLQAGPHVIGWATGIAASTVHAILRRNGCSKLTPRLPRQAIVRYERERPGELVHVDCEKLGRILVPGHRVHGDRSRRATRGKAGWQYMFVAIDDATRLGFACIYPNETADSAVAFLDACDRFYRRARVPQSLPVTPRPRRADTASARQRPIWDIQLGAGPGERTVATSGNSIAAARKRP